MTPEQRLQLTAGLREFADFLDAHPELPVASVTDMHVFLGYLSREQTHEPALKLWARAFGTFDRIMDTFYFRLKHRFRGFTVLVNADRDRVCRKVSKTITQTVDVWECPDSLLEPEAVPAEESVQAP